MSDSIRKPPFFSVVIPTYNRADLLRLALESVFQQDFQDFEVIVVDDGSTEDLSPHLAWCGGKATILRQENAGPGAARNRGVSAARGEYVAFLDSDDLWFPWTLRTQSEAILRGGKPAMIMGCPRPFRDPEELGATCDGPIEFACFSDFFESAPADFFVGSCGLTVRRSNLTRIGGFDGRVRNAEDLDLMLRLGVDPGYVVITSPPTFAYRQHASNSINDVPSASRGAIHLVRQELGGIYPGDPVRTAERRSLLTRFVRPPSIAALKCGKVSEGWSIYRSTFVWHIRMMRVKYLLGFPVLYLLSLLRIRVSPVQTTSPSTHREPDE